jgi:DUF2075 family protein
MTDFRIERLPFNAGALSVWGSADERHTNWPVVYTINGDKQIYVGETVNPVGRMLQHLQSDGRKHLKRVQIVFHDRFNKSVCLDLESQLIRYFAADGQFEVLNRNHGLTDADYFDRETYREGFAQLFEDLREQGYLTRTIPDLENDDLFKFSPFKSLTSDQAAAVGGIVESILADVRRLSGKTLVVQGDPGTGKTIVTVYLVKLLVDIGYSRPGELVDQDSMFSEFFEGDEREHLRGLRIGLVIPQQSLRKTLQRVFNKTPGLAKDMILTPFQVGESREPYDLLIVDEAHRLSLRANQPSAAQNTKFRQINERLFGRDSNEYTQLDWVKAQSAHQVLLIDSAQSVKPSDLPRETLMGEVDEARRTERFFHLHSQMRVNAGSDYIRFVEDLLDGKATTIPDFGDYEFKVFTNLADMRRAIIEKDREVGLSRLVAGYAWEWKSKNDPTAYDIELDGVKLRWNSTATDWINSPGSVNEVGSIHTVQGYDLNYAGVIIGNDLQWDPDSRTFTFNRDSYFDKKGKENNPRLGRSYSDDDLLEYVKNIYRVLLTRGVRGTFVLAEFCMFELGEA